MSVVQNRFNGTAHGTAPKTPDDWARIWFSKLASFHKVHDPQGWFFTRDDVISFLQDRRDKGAPAWKRLKSVQGLIRYRDKFLKAKTPELDSIRAKLRQISFKEKQEADNKEESVEPLVENRQVEEDRPPVNPNENEAVQRLRVIVRKKGDAYNTEKAYVKWLKRFMLARGLRTIADFGPVTGKDVESFLTDLAVDGGVAASTQEQAFYGLLYFFDHALEKDVRGINALRSDKRKLVPTVMHEAEVAGVLRQMSGNYLLMAQLLYGTGMRIGECLRLRVMDIDFHQLRIRVWNSKGNKSRFVPLPKRLVPVLERLVAQREELHEHDQATGMASVWLPDALARKYPNAHREFKWQFLFASHKFSRQPFTDFDRRPRDSRFKRVRHKFSALRVYLKPGLKEPKN